jgi:RNA polymerase sigma-70 factor (ECF subfamily)
MPADDALPVTDPRIDRGIVREEIEYVEAALNRVTAVSRESPLPSPPDLEEVFSRFVDPVYRFLYSRVGNRQDAEDLTSEVFLKATRQLDSSRAEASVAQWLFTVARTVLADHWRRHYRGGAILPLDETRAGDIPEDAAPVESSRNEEAVARVLSLLPDRYRVVLELRFLRGYSIGETAVAMGVTPENVKVMQHRALAKAVQLTEAP